MSLEELMRGMEQEINSLRKQLESEQIYSSLQFDQLNELRSSRDADIERAIRLTIAQCDSYTTGGSYRVAGTIVQSVLAQVKEQGK